MAVLEMTTLAYNKEFLMKKDFLLNTKNIDHTFNIVIEISILYQIK